MNSDLGRKEKLPLVRLSIVVMTVLHMPLALCAAPAVDIENSPLAAYSCNTAMRMALSGNKMVQGETFAYIAGFSSGTWSGSLKKYPVVAGSKGSPQIVASALWDAADVLTGTAAMRPILTPQQRKIFTGKADSGTGWSTVEFLWDALSEKQRQILSGMSTAGGYDPTGQQRLEYLRGDRRMEAGQVQGVFRKRDRLLGDIVGSNPVFVGAPAWNRSGAAYQAFRERYQGRRKAVYVGANDGMLHAFDAVDGTELFAYVPAALLPVLPQLTRIDYRHRPYVDGSISVTEAELQGSWRTVLVAGMGGGAQGVFALDISDPADFSHGKGALWEFTDSDDSDMGNVPGVPLIAKFKTGDSKGTPLYRYFAVVANGMNSYKENGDQHFNSDAAGALFLLALDKPATEKWRLGVNYFKFKTPIKNSALPNGLMAPALAIGEDGAVRVVYAGDLQGNLWRFDFSGTKPWTDANPGTTPLFVALDERQRRQPISSRPSIAFAPGGGYVVLFGTGKYLENSDAVAANFGMQSFYGIHDSLHKLSIPLGRRDLALRILSRTSGNAVQVSGRAFDYGATATSMKGWYVDFPDSDKTGERSVTDSVLASGRIFFNSLLAGGPCPVGERSYVLDALTGLSADMVATGHIVTTVWMGVPALLETGSGSSSGKSSPRRTYVTPKLDADDAASAGSSTAEPRHTADDMPGIASPEGRFSWREIINWRELRATAGKKKGKT